MAPSSGEKKEGKPLGSASGGGPARQRRKSDSSSRFERLTHHKAPGSAGGYLLGAVLVGIGGARWLTNEVDKKLLRAAGTEAAQANPTPNLARAFAAASPANALKMAAAAPR